MNHRDERKCRPSILPRLHMLYRLVLRAAHLLWDTGLSVT